MNKDELIHKINSGIVKTTEEVTAEVMGQIKPTKMDLKTYNNLRTYRNRHEKKGLGHKALVKLFDFFGYEPLVVWIKKEKK